MLTPSGIVDTATSVVLGVPDPVLALGLCGVLGINLAIGIFGYRAALAHICRMAAIEPPEEGISFRSQPELRADQPLTPEDIDEIEEWK